MSGGEKLVQGKESCMGMGTRKGGQRGLRPAMGPRITGVRSKETEVVQRPKSQIQQRSGRSVARVLGVFTGRHTSMGVPVLDGQGERSRRMGCLRLG